MMKQEKAIDFQLRESHLSVTMIEKDDRKWGFDREYAEQRI